MDIGFGSNVDTSRNVDPRLHPSNVGPGAYRIPGALRKTLPNFTPFSSSAPQRESLVQKTVTPAPGNYEIKIPKDVVSCVSVSLKSKTERFHVKELTNVPGPGAYALKPVIGDIKIMSKKAKSKSTELLSVRQSAPSIPTKFQGFGYDNMDYSGSLIAHEPERPGHTGVKEDTVGPGEYDPNVNIKFRHTPKINFAKYATRSPSSPNADDQSPGPNTYDPPLLFPINSGKADTKLSFHKFAEQNRQLSSFKSSTRREFPITQPDVPGPNSYDFPDQFEVKERPASMQFFTSKEERFRNPVPKTFRMKTCPGSYTPLTSDFDKQRLRILKEKRMRSRSDWAQNVGFETTVRRFEENTPIGPAVGTYNPKVSFIDNLQKPNVRGGDAFGSRVKRFPKEKKSSQQLDMDDSIFEDLIIS